MRYCIIILSLLGSGIDWAHVEQPDDGGYLTAVKHIVRNGKWFADSIRRIINQASSSTKNEEVPHRTPFLRPFYEFR